MSQRGFRYRPLGAQAIRDYIGARAVRGYTPANPVAATSAENPLVNDPEAPAAPATTPAPERATERPRYSRSNQEWEAAKALAAILLPDDSVKRDAEALPFVRQFMSGRDYPFSKRGFLERIWRDARFLAALDPLGKPGPKNQERIRSTQV
jgi:hypothetical protein